MSGTGRPAVGVLMAVDGEDADLVRSLDARGSGLVVVRRCGDVPELLAGAMAGLGALAVVSTDFDELDRTVIDRLASAGMRGVILSADPASWLSTGWKVMGRQAKPEEVRACVQDLARQAGSSQNPADQWGPDDEALLAAEPRPAEPGGRDRTQESGRTESARSAGPAGRSEAVGAPAMDPEAFEAPGRRGGEATWLPTRPGAGRLVAVWGTHGAPGRSTVAISLAHGLSVDGGALLADADVNAPSLVQLLGLPDDSSSLATAARLGSHSRLDEESFSRLLLPVVPGLSLLSGLGRPGRWRELPPVAMDEVWRHCRQAAAWTVVDIAGGAVDNEVDDFTLEPGQGAMAASLLAQADVVVVVGSADPVGIHRLLQLLADIEGTGQVTGRVEVVVNRVRAAAAGPSPERTVREALERFGGLSEAVLLPEDSVADASALAGVTVLEADPSSDLARSLAVLIDRIDPEAGACSAAARARRRGALARVRQAVAGLLPSRTPLEAGSPEPVPQPAAAGAGVPGSPDDVAGPVVRGPEATGAGEALPAAPASQAPAHQAGGAPWAPEGPGSAGHSGVPRASTAGQDPSARTPAVPAAVVPPPPAAPVAPPAGGLVPGGLRPQPPIVPPTAPAQAPQPAEAPGSVPPAPLGPMARMPAMGAAGAAGPAGSRTQVMAPAPPARPVHPGLRPQAVEMVQPGRPSGNPPSAPPEPPRARTVAAPPPPESPAQAAAHPTASHEETTATPARRRARSGRRVDPTRPVDGRPAPPPASEGVSSDLFAPRRATGTHRAPAQVPAPPDAPPVSAATSAPPPPPMAAPGQVKRAHTALSAPLPPSSLSAPAAPPEPERPRTPPVTMSRRGRLEAVPPLPRSRTSGPSPDSAVSLPSSLLPAPKGGRLEAVRPLRGAAAAAPSLDHPVTLPPSVAPGRGRLEVVPPLPASPDTGRVEPLPEPRPTTRREMREISRRRAVGRDRG